MARHTERVVETIRPDLVMVAQPLAAMFLKVSCPVVITHDQTFSERLSYFPFERRPPDQEYVDKALRQEAILFHNVDLIASPSKRTIDTIRQLYAVPEEKLAFIPWGGNLPSEQSREQALTWLSRRRLDEGVITLIGVDWARKGGEVVMAALHELRSRGVKVHLNVIGVAPPGGAGDSVNVMPLLNKTHRSKDDLEQVSKTAIRCGLSSVAPSPSLPGRRALNQQHLDL